MKYYMLLYIFTKFMILLKFLKHMNKFIIKNKKFKFNNNIFVKWSNKFQLINVINRIKARFNKVLKIVFL
jgi:hypothetical protein